MNDAFLVSFLKPLFVFGLFVFIVIPIELLFIKFFPEGRIKRLLLRRW